jgi:hypothetical protein
MWAKGQVAGLMEVNEALQVQLEQQAQELEQLKAALERCAIVVCCDCECGLVVGVRCSWSSRRRSRIS